MRMMEMAHKEHGRLKWNGLFDAVYDGAASDWDSVYPFASKSNVASTSPFTLHANVPCVILHPVAVFGTTVPAAFGNPPCSVSDRP